MHVFGKSILMCVVGLLFLGCKDSAPVNYPKIEGEITWIDISTAEKINNKSGKMYFIDMYTDWCGWCKVMDRKTFTDKEVIAYMDENFHNIKFDAEQREAVVFADKEYEWQPYGRNGVNLLAMFLLDGRLSYPSYVILDADKKPITVARGYMPPEKFLPQMKALLN